ncbi:hypothetical protein DBV10_01570, partial [Acidovorax sp. FJL06]
MRIGFVEVHVARKPFGLSLPKLGHAPQPFGLSLSKPWRAGLEGVLGSRAEAGLSPRQATHF